jgi:hypothetical protein
MQFVIDNLQYYLHADVIEVQHRTLLKHIGQTATCACCCFAISLPRSLRLRPIGVRARAAESNDFETVRRAHDEFLSQLSKSCFLHNRVSPASTFPPVIFARSRALPVCVAHAGEDLRALAGVLRAACRPHGCALAASLRPQYALPTPATQRSNGGRVARAGKDIAPELDEGQIQAVEEHFLESFGRLFTALSSKGDSFASPHLAQVLLARGAWGSVLLVCACVRVPSSSRSIAAGAKPHR